MSFINTSYSKTVESLQKGIIENINNPLYLFNNGHANSTTYYNKDTGKSTLDANSGQEYNTIGPGSPSRFNKIENAIIIGLEKVQISLENGENGIEANEIAGDAIVLPNTFVPFPGDFFKIDYLKEKVLFKVTDVQTDTLDNGTNFYKLSYKLDQHSDRLDQLEQYNLNDNYKMITGNVGTNLQSVIKSADYDTIANIEAITATLKQYYTELFFRPKIQTFVYEFNGSNFYDPYMIEFLKRNKILSGLKEYIYIDHACRTENTFTIEYDKTFLRAVETCDKTAASKCNLIAIANVVDDIYSLLTKRLEDYFMITYKTREFYPFITKLDIYPKSRIDAIINNTAIIGDDAYWNVIIQYFNSDKLSSDAIDLIQDIKFENSRELFYTIPILIFILEDYVPRMIKRIK